MAGDRLGRRPAVGHPGVVEAITAQRESDPVDREGAELRSVLVVVGVEEDELVGVANLDEPAAQRVIGKSRAVKNELLAGVSAKERSGPLLRTGL